MIKRLICAFVTSLFCASCVLSQDVWDVSFSLIDAIELNLNELKNSNELQKSYNSDMIAIIDDSLNLVKEQGNTLRQWGKLWNETEDVLKTQQRSLERSERKCKILGISIVIAVPTAAIVGFITGMVVSK